MHQWVFRCIGCEIAGLRQLKEIRDEPDAGYDVLPKQRKCAWQQNDPADEVGGEQNRYECRKYSAYPTRVEPRRRKIAGLHLRHDDAGDQEPGNDEENIDSDKSTRHQLGLGMIEHHQQDGDRAQAVNIRSIRRRFSVRRKQHTSILIANFWTTQPWPSINTGS